MTRIAGSTVLITGAASGLGRMLARDAAARGARVIGWDIDRAGLDSLRAETGADTYHCDVSDPAAVAGTAATVRTEVGAVDVLVNNAGIISGARLLDLSDERITATFGVNVLALYWTTRAFLPDMIARGRGHVVTVASAAGLIGVARQTDYAASKHAALGFDESLRMELRQIAPRVRTTVVCPYYVDTGMFDGTKSRWPWLLPILQPQDVINALLGAVERDRRRVFLPRVVYLLPVLRALPPALFDRLADLLGINTSMEDFTGRSRPT